MNHLRVLLPGLLALSMLLLSARDSSAAQGTFNPATFLALSNGDANTAADVTTIFTLTAPDMNVGVIVDFIPPEWGVAEAGDLAIGTQVGGLTSVTTLGILNGPCTTTTPVVFDLLNGSIDTADTIAPLPAATSNRLSTLIPPNGVNKYPSYLNPLFGGVANSEIQARLVGHAVVAGLDVILNLVIFKPGTQLPLAALIHRYVQDPLAFDPQLGFPTVIVLQDPTAPEGPSSITDFCTPLVIYTTTFANVRTNPGPGNYTWVTFAASQRNAADGDSLENGLDTCPFVTNIEDVRVPFPAGDPDLDGIDSACDNTSVFTDGNPTSWDDASPCRLGTSDDFLAADCDADGFSNRQDNCPQHSNPLQEDADFDGIGDACDTLGAGPNTPDGTPIEFHLARCMTIPGGTFVAGPCVAVLPVGIDIKPGSDPNSINPKIRGTIPVAILSSPDFDAPSELDMALLTFGRTGDEESLAFCTRSAEDVNDDGLLDQVCHFHTQDTGFQCGDTEGILRGETLDGVPIEGTDSVVIVPCR